jgi:hypothetical protein
MERTTFDFLCLGLFLSFFLACNSESNSQPASPTQPETAQAGRQLLLANQNIECSYGVAMNCPMCAVRFTGPGLLEMEWNWQLSGAPASFDFVLNLNRRNPPSCGAWDFSVTPPLCLGIAYERDASKHPWRLSYEVPDGSQEYGVDVTCRPGGFPYVFGPLSIWYTKR